MVEENTEDPVTSRPLLKFHLSPADNHCIVLSVAPFNVMPPALAVTSVGVATDPNSIFLSSTVRVAVFIVVVVPPTVKSVQFKVPNVTLLDCVTFWSIS